MEKKRFMVNPLSNLQEAIDEAQKNLSVVEFTTGNYFVDKPLVISKPVVIRGNGSTIRGGHNGVVFDIKDEANVPDTEIRDCRIIPFSYST